MSGLLSLLVLGFVLGMRHATDPDHVVAVSTIVARHRKAGSAAWLGAMWGVGHTFTILVVGGAIIGFRWAIPPRIGLSMELAVGLMLILLGLMNLSGIASAIRSAATTSQPHSHPHAHGDYVHTHPHDHAPERHPHDERRTPVSWLDRRLGSLSGYQLIRPLAIGVIHGLAGSAAVALLVLGTIADPAWAVFYLAVFGVGTIVGMMLITTLIAVPFRYAAGRSPRWGLRLRLATGVLSLGLGGFIAYQMAIGHGLFTAAPRWTPQ